MLTQTGSWRRMQDAGEGMEDFDLLTISEDGKYFQLNRRLVQYFEVR